MQIKNHCIVSKMYGEKFNEAIANWINFQRVEPQRIGLHCIRFHVKVNAHNYIKKSCIHQYSK